MGKIFLSMVLLMSCGVFLNHYIFVNAKTKSRIKPDNTPKVDSYAPEEINNHGAQSSGSENRYHKKNRIKEQNIYRESNPIDLEVDVVEGYDVTNASPEDDSSPIREDETALSSFKGEVRRPLASQSRNFKNAGANPTPIPKQKRSHTKAKKK